MNLIHANDDINIQSKYMPGTWRGQDASFTVRGKVETAQFKAFREKYPNIKIDGTSRPVLIEGIGTESSDLLAIAAGNAANIFEFNYRQSGTFIDKGFLSPLDRYIRDDLTAEEAQERGEFDENIMYQDELEERILPKVIDLG